MKIRIRKKYQTNVAIKTLKPNEDIETNNPENEEKELKKEIDFLSSMKHPNIVQFFGWTVWRNKN